jgi:hypothetical protein
MRLAAEHFIGGSELPGTLVLCVALTGISKKEAYHLARRVWTVLVGVLAGRHCLRVTSSAMRAGPTTIDRFEIRTRAQMPRFRSIT